MEDGWRPSPFREFIVKVHSRCDLSCDYCYMYEMADQSWRDQPRAMSREIADLTARRIGEHARAHDLRDVTLILHGGEPLLAGQDLISRLVTSTRRWAGHGTTVHAAIQTNGVGLSEAYLRLFDEIGVRVGVSVDGYPDAHDRHRRFASGRRSHQGRGSYQAVSTALRRLRRFPHLYGGLLCTIDLRNDPVRTYRALADFGPPKVDFLLPHGTWSDPPPMRVPGAADTPYADWLAEVFDYWYPKPQTGIRLFEEIMHLLLGGASDSEVVGLGPARMVVIETDGSVEQEDTLKSAYAGATETGLHVARDPLDAALRLPRIAARQIGVRALSKQCRACPVRTVCGGGLYPHRYREGTGFLNPSVYCPDLLALIRHIRDRVREDLISKRAGAATG
ncbi:MAG: FxsB family radical SAM/SPASM domain protein [Nocardiopsaceae bacterium]|nr:FxsB family radical SAM/SPASM domain protein [Nocardiopsaceae bacterium]